MTKPKQHNSKAPIATKNLKTPIVIKLKNSSCDKTQSQIVTKP